VLIGGVIQHQVKDDADAAAVCLRQQAVKILQGAHTGIHRIVIGYIVPIIPVRSGVEGGQPKGIHPQVLQVIEMMENTLQIAQSISVGISEGAGVEVVNHAVPPPGPVCCHGKSSRKGWNHSITSRGGDFLFKTLILHPVCAKIQCVE